MKWQAIETAPLGKVILLFAVTDRDESGEVTNWKMATGHTPFDDPTEWTWDGYRLREWDVKPTHWRPLPEPPEQRRQEGIGTMATAAATILGLCGLMIEFQGKAGGAGFFIAGLAAIMALMANLILL